MLEKRKVKPRAAEKTLTAGHQPTFLRLQPHVRRENDDDAAGQSGGVGRMRYARRFSAHSLARPWDRPSQSARVKGTYVSPRIQ